MFSLNDTGRRRRKYIAFAASLGYTVNQRNKIVGAHGDQLFSDIYENDICCATLRDNDERMDLFCYPDIPEIYERVVSQENVLFLEYSLVVDT